MQRLGGRVQYDEPLVVIDYAHTPDALEQTLTALRPVASERGGALVCVFGCGGERDTGKRPTMGAIAERLADAVVITSDNPRGEAPSAIMEAIAAGMQERTKARCIEDRASAILQAIRSAARADVVVLAGKGHEATQEIMGKKRLFSDQDHARLALAARAAQPRGDAS
jgi:UDP-N-acetylmuramoyl-L-alanyl-D-glutamate--2,6-diaminopimelate ligase